ncbi:MAG: DNA replication/repair protein RecF [Ferrovibrio sp.]|uniref:DNA replication/repair protein RecF n=1 Tax=Ferrovibrio sp. TaxID=1917215 RepID=UPI003918F0F8
MRSAALVAEQSYEGATAGGTAVLSLSLRDFRNYAELHLRLSGQPVVLTGPNGAGKTNILEALSFFSPGRGLRRARLSEVSRVSGQPARRCWVAHAELATAIGPVAIGTGLAEAVGDEELAERRIVRINGEPAASANGLAEYLDVVWLTPQMDRLFVEGLSTRRRFMDRLVYGLDGGHARQVAAFERAMRERNRLLKMGGADPAWLAALESQMAEHGVAVAAARREALGRIEAGMALATGPFPRARLAAQGVIEAWLADMPALAAEEKYRAVLAERRGIDREAGAATEGPHRSDMAVWHAEKDQPAALCSTGEQKALLIAITLANARLIRARRQMAPLMLLDEISAHLDARRRAALYEELLALGGQVWLTGTDDDLFTGLAGQAEFFTVADGVVTPRAAFS